MEQEARCPLCDQLMQHSLTFPCGHGVCEVCLGAYQQDCAKLKRGEACPVCLQKPTSTTTKPTSFQTPMSQQPIPAPRAAEQTQTTAQNAGAIPENYHSELAKKWAVFLGEMAEGNKLFECCNSASSPQSHQKPTHTCTKCGYLCAECSATHQGTKKPAFAKHKLREITKVELKTLEKRLPPALQPDRCKFHNRTFASLCMECQPASPLCPVCLAIHKIKAPEHSHNLAEIHLPQSQTHMLEETNTIAEYARKKSDLLEKVASNLETDFQKAVQYIEQFETTVRDHFAQLRNQLDRVEKEIIELANVKFEHENIEAFRYMHDIEISSKIIDHALQVHENAKALSQTNSTVSKLVSSRQKLVSAITRPCASKAKFKLSSFPSPSEISLTFKLGGFEKLKESNALLTLPPEQMTASDPLQYLLPLSNSFPHLFGSSSETSSLPKIRGPIRNIQTGISDVQKTFVSTTPKPNMQPNNPRQISVHPKTGRIYLADESNHRFLVYDADLNTCQGFGSKGNDVGQFQSPFGVAVHPQGKKVAMYDQSVGVVQVFDSDLKESLDVIHLSKNVVQTPSSLAGSRRSRLSAVENCVGNAFLHYDSRGYLYVCLSEDRTVKEFDPAGRFVRNVIDQNHRFFGPNALSGMAVMPNDEIAVMAFAGNEVKFFDRDGSLLRTYPVEKTSNWNLLAPSASGGFVISSPGDNEIRFYASNGMKIKTIRHERPWGVVFGLNDRFYVADCQGQTISYY